MVIASLKNRGSSDRQSASLTQQFASVCFSGSVPATDRLVAYNRAVYLLSQRQRWPPQDIAVTRATPPPPPPLTHTTPLVPNRTTKDTMTTAPRNPTPTATLTPQTTAFTTSRTESGFTIDRAMIHTVRCSLEPFATQRHSFTNIIQTLIQRTMSTANAMNPRLNRLPPLVWGSPNPQHQQ